MARNEADREDLLREATALVERLELASPQFEDSVVVGFRRSGAGSVFFGADPVLQFDSAGRLRRGFYRRNLLKAEDGRLVEMTRERTDAESILWRRELDDAEQAALLAEFDRWIDRLAGTLDGPDWRLVGQAPPESDVVGRVRRWLAELPRPLQTADRPHAV